MLVWLSSEDGYRFASTVNPQLKYLYPDFKRIGLPRYMETDRWEISDPRPFFQQSGKNDKLSCNTGNLELYNGINEGLEIYGSFISLRCESKAYIVLKA